MSIKINLNNTSDILSPTSWYKTREGLRIEMSEKWKQYGSDIKYVSEITNLPASCIFSFMIIESGGANKIGKSGLYPGLMKFNKNLVYEKIEKEKNSGRMTTEEENLLNNYGITLTNTSDGFKVGGSSITLHKVGAIVRKEIKTETMLMPKLNIYIGAMLIGQYLDTMIKILGLGLDMSESDSMKAFALVAIRYNAGPEKFDDYQSKLVNLNAYQMTVAPYLASETRDYIRKLLGKNGAWNIAVKDLGINY